MDITSFAELGLSAKVLAAIEAVGYTTPTPIQAQAIPVAMTGRDVLGIAQTGTGKTASFVLPMLARLEAGRARSRMPRSLILCPTRELAAQCAASFDQYGTNHKLTVALLIGGVSFDDQLRKLDRGADVLIATPGRMLDHFQRGKLLLTGVEILVIDEADRMLDMGFIPDIERICKLLPPARQTLFFSATMPPEITRLVGQFLKDPTRIEVAPPATAASTITQRFLYCAGYEDWAKRETLRGLIASQAIKNAIIFCNRKRDVAILLKSMLKHGYNAGALHGDMDQSSRTATLQAFRDGKLTFLVASDVAARGLDIPDVSHVINFDVPWQSDDYVHRIGRTGRAGKEGVAASIVTSDDMKSLDGIQKMLGEEIVWIGEPPDAATLAERPKRRGGRRSAAAPARRDGRGGARDGGRRERGERSETRGPRRERDAGRDLERAPIAGEALAAEAAVPVARAAEPLAAVEPSSVKSDAPREGRGRRRRGRERDAAAPATDHREENMPQFGESHSDQRARHVTGSRPRAEGRNEGRNEGRSEGRSEGRAEERRPERESRPEREGRPEEGRPERERRPEQRRERVPKTPVAAGHVHPAARPPRERGDRSGGGPDVVGLGDHVPAFLRRPSRLVRP